MESINNETITKEEIKAIDQNQPLFAVMDKTNISMIATESKRFKDILRTNKDWQNQVLSVESGQSKVNKLPDLSESQKCTFPLEYIFEFLKLAKKETSDITLHVKKDHPLGITIKSKDYDGELKTITFFVAPRIESDND